MSTTMYRPGGATNGKPGGGTRVPVISPEDYLKVCEQRDEANARIIRLERRLAERDDDISKVSGRLASAIDREDLFAGQLSDEIDSHNETTARLHGIATLCGVALVIAVFFVICWTVQFSICQGHWDELPKAVSR